MHSRLGDLAYRSTHVRNKAQDWVSARSITSRLKHLHSSLDVFVKHVVDFYERLLF